MKRERNAKIVATLGPASADEATIRALFEAGADVFRLNFSHGVPEDHAVRIGAIRRIESELGRPIGVLLDLQGPKLRLGTFQNGSVRLAAGSTYRLDLDLTAGDSHRAPLPHPEIFSALEAGTELLIDDGKLRLRVDDCGADFAKTTVLVGGVISDRKGVNVPKVVLPLSALTTKDRNDLDFGLKLGVDWVALSFVQRPEDVEEARAIIGDRAWVMAKLEKPAALDRLADIIAVSDGVMVARGDLGVELPPEEVPEQQRRIVSLCRAAGKPVVVATQMLESMIHAPVPTRAEVSDIANAIYEGADAVMLSAETASGSHALAAVAMMDRIIARTESSASYRKGIDASHTAATATTADAICSALRQAVSVLAPAAVVTYTSSGFTTLRAARERPAARIVSLTPIMSTARRLSLVWGTHAVAVDDVHDTTEMVRCANRITVIERFAGAGADIVIVAGLPFGESGSTNLMHISRIGGPARGSSKN